MTASSCWAIISAVRISAHDAGTKMKGASHSRSKYVIDLTTVGILVTPLLRGGT